MNRIVAVAGLLAVCACGAALADSGDRADRYFPTLDAATAPAERVDTGTPVKVTAYWENDGGWVRPIERRDEHYTHGAGISIAFRPAWARELSGLIPSFNGLSFGDEFASDGASHAVGLVIAQELYTPENYLVTRPLPDDRPYAGYLHAGFFLQRARTISGGGIFSPEATYEHLQVDVGMTGPSSLAEDAQILVHERLAYDVPRGWANQVKDEPTVDFTYVRKWRYTAWLGYNAFQAIPEFGVTVGTVHREATLGTTFRWSLIETPDDFGPARLALPGAFTDTRGGDSVTNFGLQLFGRPAVHFVEHNALIAGNNWRNSVVRQDIEPIVGEFQFGLSVQMFRHIEVGYSWTYRTPEFGGQRGWDSNGALNVSLTGSF